MCDLALDPSKHEDTTIAGSGLKVRYPGVHEVAEILIGHVEMERRHARFEQSSLETSQEFAIDPTAT